jgi:hypothetical protein
MTLQRQTDGSVRIAGLDDWHLEALRRIPQLALPGEDERALRRVFPAPYAAGDASVEQQEDWAEYVQPELEALFEGSLHRVREDLKTAHLAEPAPPSKGRDRSATEEQEPEWVINVPADHVEDWFRAMNQARLVLSSTQQAHRQDQDYVAGMIARGDLEVLVQYEMLTALCGWWVEVLLNNQ